MNKTSPEKTLKFLTELYSAFLIESEKDSSQSLLNIPSKKSNQFNNGIDVSKIRSIKSIPSIFALREATIEDYHKLIENTDKQISFLENLNNPKLNQLKKSLDLIKFKSQIIKELKKLELF